MPRFHISPLSKTLVVEGRARRQSVRGIVLAMGWWENGDDPAPRGAWGGAAGPSAPDMQYLVSDPTKPSPIWVDGRQLVSQGVRRPRRKEDPDEGSR